MALFAKNYSNCSLLYWRGIYRKETELLFDNQPIIINEVYHQYKLEDEIEISLKCIINQCAIYRVHCTSVYHYLQWYTIPMYNVHCTLYNPHRVSHFINGSILETHYTPFEE